ncbi:hypothetical protein P7D22_04985 [Lichenihabitans sp. Uapishka_5]|nr:hypothetical protein [Lichenihabitans sp. Uapishka_5]
MQGLAGRVTGSNQTHAEGLVNEAVGTAQNLYGQAVDGVRDASDAVTDYAEQAYRQGSRSVRGGSRSIEKQLSQHPLTGVMVAGAIGFVLGVVVMSTRG